MVVTDSMEEKINKQRNSDSESVVERGKEPMSDKMKKNFGDKLEN